MPGRKPHYLEFAHLKPAPGLASESDNAYRSDKTDAGVESCSDLDGGPRAQWVRKGGFMAASIAVAGWPERRRL